MESSNIQNNLTKRWSEILKIAWPLILANSFWNLQLTIDRIFLGSFSTESLGAAMTVMGIFWTPMALLQQTSGYVTTFVAQYYGAKDYKMIGPSVWQSLYLSLIGGLLFLLFLLFSENVFNFIGHSESIKKLEIDYFNALCFSALPTAIVAGVSGFYSGMGQTKVIMLINAMGLIFNVLFDYMLIFGNWGAPAMGIAGAGYATAIANYAAALFGLFLIFRHKKNQTDFALWTGRKLNWELSKRFLRYGLPSGLQWSLEGLAFTIFLVIMGNFPNGEVALASSSIATTILMLAVLPSLGIAQAVMILVGQHLGEHKPDEAERATWSGLQVSVIYMLFMSLSFLLIPQFYLSWFKNESNPELWRNVQAMVPLLLIYIAIFATLDGVNLNLSFALKGAGDTKFVSLVSLLLPWPVMILPTYLMKDWQGAVYWAWGAATVYGMALALTYYLRFRGAKWKSMTVIK
jgi:MATE family multidrug resistance protein